MSEQTLPAVAKTVHLDCKKCQCERFFIVVAHTSETSAKVKCEVCGAQKTYKLESEKKAKKAKSETGEKKPKKTRASAEEGRRSGHNSEYEKLLSESKGDATSYSMKVNFVSMQKVQHPKFGLGVVRVSMPEKIEVIFSDEVKLLVHNRPA